MIISTVSKAQKMRMIMQGKATSLHMVNIDKSLDEELQRYRLKIATIHMKKVHLQELIQFD